MFPGSKGLLFTVTKTAPPGAIQQITHVYCFTIVLQQQWCCCCCCRPDDDDDYDDAADDDAAVATTTTQHSDFLTRHTN